MGNMEENKIHWEALGFPVWLVGFKMKKVRGNEVPDVNMKKIQGQAFKALILHQHRFTGSQVRFIRSYLRLTQNEFAREINVNHSSVSIWESKGDDLTGMETNTELILRLYMLHSHGSPHFRKAVITMEWKRMSLLLNKALFGATDMLSSSEGSVTIKAAVA
jgi:DNA-binding transcriptional regulator YiaG